MALRIQEEILGMVEHGFRNLMGGTISSVPPVLLFVTSHPDLIEPQNQQCHM